MKCGRGPKDSREKNVEPCPVVKERRLDAVHGGNRSGRACWVVAGTFCGGNIQGTFAQKDIACKRCDFYKKVFAEEGAKIESNHSLLQRLKEPPVRVDISKQKLGILLGGSGMIGGALTHYFKVHSQGNVDVLSPNSTKLSLREHHDILRYFKKYQPDFIINCAIAPLDSDAQMAYEINYLGSVRLAKMAIGLKIPYIHFSSSAIMPMRGDLSEGDVQPLQAKMSNYAKSKLMAEKTLLHLHEAQGLDCTIIRLGVVYGKHDHKVQGVHRMIFSIADQSMPFIMSRPGVFHSYTNSEKVPPFVDYILENREEFTGKIYNFVDREPVEMISLIKAIKKQLGVKMPRNICIPYPFARTGSTFIRWMVKKLSGVGLEVKMPPELMFMKNFYKSQTLQAKNLEQSSYFDSLTDVSIYTELPDMLEYYMARWHHFNLLSSDRKEPHSTQVPVGQFIDTPQELVDLVHRNSFLPFDEFNERF